MSLTIALGFFILKTCQTCLFEKFKKYFFREQDDPSSNRPAFVNGILPYESKLIKKNYGKNY